MCEKERRAHVHGITILYGIMKTMSKFSIFHWMLACSHALYIHSIISLSGMLPVGLMERAFGHNSRLTDKIPRGEDCCLSFVFVTLFIRLSYSRETVFRMSEIPLETCVHKPADKHEHCCLHYCCAVLVPLHCCCTLLLSDFL